MFSVSYRSSDEAAEDVSLFGVAWQGSVGDDEYCCSEMVCYDAHRAFVTFVGLAGERFDLLDDRLEDAGLVVVGEAVQQS